MNWFYNARIATKLLLAFSLCAAITLIVGAIGSQGVSSLSSSLQLTFSNNLVSVAKTAEAKSNAVAQNKDVFRLLTMTAAGEPRSELDKIIASLNENRIASEKAFAVYRATPQADDERAAGNQMEKDWPAYQALVDKTIALANAGDLDAARALATDELQETYRTIINELTIMVESNNRQIEEGADAADEREWSAKRNLYIGIGVAFVAAIGLGVFISRSISAPIVTAVTAAQRIADGDLTQPVHSARKDEAGQLLTALGDMQTQLRETIQQVVSSASQLASAAEQLNVVTGSSSQGLIRQSDEIQLAATAVTEMTAAVEEVARNASSTSEASNITAEDARKGRDQVREAATAINNVTDEVGHSAAIVGQLAESVRDIAKVVDVIRGIAEQTNLLALNAAIEAARAGEQGRGFAVVADEVRALAARTQASTGEIESMISSVQTHAEGAVGAMSNSQLAAKQTLTLAQSAGAALDNITQSIAHINERNLLIATASEEQAHVAREVDQNLIKIQDFSTQTAADANQVNTSSQELSRLAVAFNGLVSGFKL